MHVRQGCDITSATGGQDRRNGLTLAVLAGSMAALGSICAKLAMSADIILHYCEEFLFGSVYCQKVTLYMRAIFFISIFICNGLMWTLFTKSLQLCKSSVEATITNTASNFMCTAVLGLVLFDEALSIRWWLGSCLIIIGLLFIHKGNEKSGLEKEKTM